jgi:hypothetical protein
MDPAWLFIGALVALHLIEGLFWVRREAVGFARGARRYRVVRPEGPFGNQRGAFLLLSPLPPLGALFVVEPWPLTPGGEAAWLVPAETLGAPEGPSPGPPRWSWAEAAKARREGKAILGPGGRSVTTSSGRLAADLVAHLHALAAAAPKGRAKAMEAALQRAHDVGAVKARLQFFEKVTARLGVYANAWLPLMLGGAYGLFFVPAAWDRAPYLLGAMGLLLVLTWVELFIAHRRLYPDLRGERALKLLLMVLSPPAASRSRAWLARDALAGFHPLAVAAALLSQDDLRAYAAEVWRDLHHPLGPDDPEAGPDLAAARARLAAAHRRVLASHGIDADTLDGPPAELEPSVRAYCPRCHEVFLEPAGPCSDCPGVAKRAVTAR